MIILDTNVISETLAPEPASRVRQWLDRQLRHGLFLTTITIAEMVAGVHKLPTGKRKTTLSVAIDEIVNLNFAGRILAFDIAAAHSYGMIFESLRQKGLNYDTADLQIAAIAQARGASIATRDIKPFHAAGLHVINPWTDE